MLALHTAHFQTNHNPSYIHDIESGVLNGFVTWIRLSSHCSDGATTSIITAGLRAVSIRERQAQALTGPARLQDLRGTIKCLCSAYSVGQA